MGPNSLMVVYMDPLGKAQNPGQRLLELLLQAAYDNLLLDVFRLAVEIVLDVLKTVRIQELALPTL